MEEEAGDRRNGRNIFVFQTEKKYMMEFMRSGLESIMKSKVMKKRNNLQIKKFKFFI